MDVLCERYNDKIVNFYIVLRDMWVDQDFAKYLLKQEEASVMNG